MILYRYDDKSGRDSYSQSPLNTKKKNNLKTNTVVTTNKKWGDNSENELSPIEPGSSHITPGETDRSGR